MHPLPNKTHESKSFFTYNQPGRISQSIASHPFNRSVTISHPAALEWALPSVGEYLIGSLTLTQLLEGDVLEAMCNKSFTAFSTTHVDSQDCFCVHQGILRLSLMKDTYQRAGLTGTKSPITPGKFNILIDFTEKEFRGSKLFARLKTSFSAGFSHPIDVMMMLDTSSAISRDLSKRQSSIYTFQETKNVPEWKDILCGPMENQDCMNSATFQELQDDILTHITLLSIPSTVPESSDPYITTYSCPTVQQTPQEVSTTTITGFISAEYITKLLKFLQASSTSETWFTIQTRGFEYTPMSWVGGEHGYLTGGENAIVILSATPPANNSPDKEPEAMHIDAEESPQSLIMWELVGSRDTYS